MHYSGNFIDTFVIVNQILTDFNANMRQSDFFRVMIDCVVLRRLARIRFVVSDPVSGRRKVLEEDIAKTCIRIPKNADLLRARLPVHDRCEAVNSDK